MCLKNVWPLIMRLRSNFRWKIVYLTRDEDDGHNSEIAEAWQHTGVELKFLEFEYKDQDEKNFEISFDRDLAASKIQDACTGTDLLITHNHLGEWGHVYHVFANSVVSEMKIPSIYFGYKDDNHNNLIIAPKTYGNMEINVAVLKWHKEWIDNPTYIGKYSCDKEALELLQRHSKALNFNISSW